MGELGPLTPFAHRYGELIEHLIGTVKRGCDTLVGWNHAAGQAGDSGRGVRAGVLGLIRIDGLERSEPLWRQAPRESGTRACLQHPS